MASFIRRREERAAKEKILNYCNSLKDGDLVFIFEKQKYGTFLKSSKFPHDILLTIDNGNIYVGYSRPIVGNFHDEPCLYSIRLDQIVDELTNKILYDIQVMGPLIFVYRHGCEYTGDNIVYHVDINGDVYRGR